MRRLAVIGGTGLDRIPGFVVEGREQRATAYGAPSAPLVTGRLGSARLVFLPRHGEDHRLPPHRINYRANIAALRAAGATDVVGVTAVGGIAATAGPGAIVIPDQLIDYTCDREHTFSDGLDGPVTHVEFGEPYDGRLRQRLLAAGARLGLPLVAGGVYGATQGPRLETAAEIRRMARDGCTVVGMTGMPEAALAREAGLCYATCSLVVNWAAGLDPAPITMDAISRELEAGMARVLDLIAALPATPDPL